MPHAPGGRHHHDSTASTTPRRGDPHPGNRRADRPYGPVLLRAPAGRFVRARQVDGQRAASTGFVCGIGTGLSMG